jgi:Tfp pilus assembly protein PilF
LGLATREFETAIALDPNNANAHAYIGFLKVYLGRAEDGFAEVETAFRLSPRDPSAALVAIRSLRLA